MITKWNSKGLLHHALIRFGFWQKAPFIGTLHPDENQARLIQMEITMKQYPG